MNKASSSAPRKRTPAKPKEEKPTEPEDEPVDQAIGSDDEAEADAPKKAASSNAKRRGPGRPPSKPIAPPLLQKGIVDSPQDPNNRLEFAFGDPGVFKSLFTYLKNIRAREIHLRCTPTGLTFFARDHTRISRVVAVIDGRHVNWHYCEKELWLAINRESVEKIFASIDRTYFKITLIQTVEDPGSLICIFKDAEIDKECNYKITLSTYIPDEELYDAETTLTPEALVNNFPIEFTLSDKQFKKTVTDASNYSDTITIEMFSGQPLQITYNKANLTYNEVYRSAEKIALRSSVPENSSFRCTIKVSNIKSLAASMVTNDVTIRCREEGDMLFRSAIDAKALVVSTLTKLAV